MGPAEVASLLSTWLAGRRPATASAYRCDVAHFAAFLTHEQGLECEELLAWFLSLPPGEANRVVFDFRNLMLGGQALSSATISRRLAAVRSLVKAARRLGLVAWSLDVDSPPREAKHDRRGPNVEDLRRLVRAAKLAGDGPAALRDRAILVLLGGLALRRGEVVALDLGDVDFHASKLAVRGKGRREKVRVHLPAVASAALARWVAVRPEGPGPLFVRLDRPGASGRLTGEAVRRVLVRLTAAAGVPLVRPHGMRHSAATRLLSGGESPRDVMGLTRHANIQTLMGYDDELRDKAPALAEKASKVFK